jgi:hypothetical protein
MDRVVWSDVYIFIDLFCGVDIQEEGVPLMRSKLLAVILLLLAASVHIISLEKAADAMKQLPRNDSEDFILPSPILKIAVLEFQGLASDLLFLKTMTFIGGTQQRTEKPRVKEWEWHWVINTLDAATELDPYFFDPYYFANAFLPWDAGMAKETNLLLSKGSRYRDWDWMLPFFIGFNDFFFLQDDKDASDQLMEASRRPGGDPILASVAARLAYKENRTENAIYFLEEIAKKTEDRRLKKHYEKRIRAMRSIQYLEGAVTAYKKKFHRIPTALDELVSKNIISLVPRDPYGGTYYITMEGNVRSTASSELEPYLSPSAKKSRR